MKKKSSLTLLSLFALLLSGCNLLPTHGKKGSGNNAGGGEGTGTSQNTEGDNSVPEEGEIPEDEPSVPIDEQTQEYYASIDETKTGKGLLNELNTLNNAKRKKTVGYGGLKTALQYTEIDPKGTTPAGKMYGFYDNALVSSTWDDQATWNREHVWPKSRGGANVEGDLLMPRPTSVSINSERGNNVYGLVSGSYDPGKYVAEYRGIAARIIFYCAIADKSLNLNESTEYVDKVSMGILSQLLKWNLDYLPGGKDSESLALRIEWNRNDVNEKHADLQGNRNPFVDHPEYACRIWGSENAQTKAACGIS